MKAQMLFVRPTQTIGLFSEMPDNVFCEIDQNPITGWKIGYDDPQTFEKIKAKREWRRRTYQPKKAKHENTTTS